MQMSNQFNYKILSDKDFEKFTEIIYNESGIKFKKNKITLVSNRLRKRIKQLNLDNFSQYYKFLISNYKQELPYLLNFITTNETHFFRHKAQFDMFKKLVLAEFPDYLSVWSAGCSTGEEPYSIAIVLNEIKKNIYPYFNFKIVATDIDFNAINFAKKAQYSIGKFREMPLENKREYFHKIDDENMTINNEIKKLVNFKILNLIKDDYPKNINIIFCRNVLIYMDKKIQKFIAAKLYYSMPQSSYLFLGSSEILIFISNKFKLMKFNKASAYKKIL